ncbi:oxygen-dependent protoporphyrinogen oxidase [Rhizophlyctis rosea]|nr:oxygen-dependent protoporphyrinogen oxidase [Rhizophlyctis rosea]
MSNTHVVVLGGGISGLSTAWYLSRSLPKTASITLLERSAHLGGWVQTVKKDGFIFETGPRTLRPASESGLATLDMVYKLGLDLEAIGVPKTAPAAKKRYIYYKDTINKVPTSISEFLFNKAPVFDGTFRELIRELFVKSRPAQDESIYDYITYRFGPNIANNLFAALVHGVYAGDIKQLSIRSTFPYLWELSQKHGSITRGVMAPPEPAKNPWVLGEEELRFVRKVQSASVYSFKNGLQTLTDALGEDLRKKSNVNIVNAECTGVEFGSEHVEVKTNTQPLKATHIISALPSYALAPLLRTSAPTTSSILKQTPAVTVAVINLAYRGRLPFEGFGYLVPREGVERSGILGVVFDSCSLPAQDPKEVGDVTRVTVMMGGFVFEKHFGGASEERLLTTALNHVHESLKLQPDDLLSSLVSVQKDCIPQYTVGHAERLGRLEGTLREDTGGRLMVVGSSFNGVGVNDCVQDARRVSEAFVERVGRGGGVGGVEAARGGGGASGGVTGMGAGAGVRQFSTFARSYTTTAPTPPAPPQPERLTFTERFGKPLSSFLLYTSLSLLFLKALHQRLTFEEIQIEEGVKLEELEREVGELRVRAEQKERGEEIGMVVGGKGAAAGSGRWWPFW